MRWTSVSSGVATWARLWRANFAEGGQHFTSYNRTRSKAEALAREGGARSPIASPSLPGEILITMLADDQAVAGASCSGTRGRISGFAATASTFPGARLRRGASDHLD